MIRIFRYQVSELYLNPGTLTQVLFKCNLRVVHKLLAILCRATRDIDLYRHILIDLPCVEP